MVAEEYFSDDPRLDMGARLAPDESIGTAREERKGVKG